MIATLPCIGSFTFARGVLAKCSQQPCRTHSAGRARLWRSFFYVPGDRSSMIRKIAELPATCKQSQFGTHIPDLVVLDCEDAVGLDRKNEARTTVSEAISSPGLFSRLREQLHRTLVVRINAIDSGFETEDLTSILRAAIESANQNQGHWPGPDMICLPKVESADQLAWLSDAIHKQLSNHVHPMPSLGLVAMVESCKAIVNLKTICEQSCEMSLATPLAGIVFGSDDYCVSMGVERTPHNVELMHARSYFPVVAKAFGLASIDMVDIDFRDTEKLQANCEWGAQLGFDGKQTIHPAQLPVVNSAFSPNPERIQWYRAMLKEAEKLAGGCAGAVGVGAFNFRGRMIDRPTLRQAEHAVAVADLIEMRTR